VLLHRGRSNNNIPTIEVGAKGRTLDLTFPRNWLDDHPLTATDLEQEIEFQKTIGFKLRVT
jgi:exopolyphosphatase/guanosine-5'-triphosphate,3'-diphosphate pyrophosphatase